MADRQTEPESPLAAAEERREQAGEIGRGDARALVAHGHFEDLIAGVGRRSDLDYYVVAGFRMLNRILDQVDEDPLQPPGEHGHFGVDSNRSHERYALRLRLGLARSN